MKDLKELFVVLFGVLLVSLVVMVAPTLGAEQKGTAAQLTDSQLIHELTQSTQPDVSQDAALLLEDSLREQGRQEYKEKKANEQKLDELIDQLKASR